MQVEDQLVSVRWAADYCGVHDRTIRLWMSEGRLTTFKLDPTRKKSPVRLRKSEVQNLFQEAPYSTPKAEAVGQA